jgi:hypothetical protein
MTAIVLVLLGFIVVTGATTATDWCRTQWPALFGLTTARVAPTRSRLDA